jgi:hypothetical protein
VPEGVKYCPSIDEIFYILRVLSIGEVNTADARIAPAVADAYEEIVQKGIVELSRGAIPY